MRKLTPPTGNNYLLDTNIVIAILNREESVIARLPGNTIYISTIVLGELLFGALKSARAADNLARIEQFVARYNLLDIDRETARQYGQSKLALQQKGRPLPENDVWIAATAQQYHLPLVTRDVHFHVIDGLTVITW